MIKIVIWINGSPTLLRGYQGIRDQLPGDLWILFFNGFFEVYLFLFKDFFFK